jgi:hypothetical protein
MTTHPTRRRGNPMTDATDIAPWPDQRGQQAREFDKRCREAYALLKLMKEGELDHGAAVIAEWYERVQDLESGN